MRPSPPAPRVPPLPLPLLLLLLAILPAAVVVRGQDVLFCSGCASCTSSSCSGCAYTLMGACSTLLGWCNGCAGGTCGGSACGNCTIAGGAGITMGCDEPSSDWYSDEPKYAFLTFLFLAIMIIALIWVFLTLCRQRQQQQRRAAQEAAAAQELTDMHNPTYQGGGALVDPYPPAPGTSVPANHTPYFSSPAPEPYSYFYATDPLPLSRPAAAAAAAAPPYAAAPPGYPSAFATAAPPPSPGFTPRDELTPLPTALPVSQPLPSPVTTPSASRRGRQQDQRQSLLSDEQRAGNSSSA